MIVARKQIMDVAGRIAREFNPDKIILFGSYAIGNPSTDSDVDILVILPFEGKSFWKSLEITNKINPSFALDLLARRPDDTEYRYEEGDPLIQDALDHGVVIYEKHN